MRSVSTARLEGSVVRLFVVGGTTETAAIDGISAAGTSPATRLHTPSADLEILTHGKPVRAPFVPVSPSGCPTPALITRAIREQVGFDCVPIDAGLAKPSAAPTINLGPQAGKKQRPRPSPGGDIRNPVAVPAAAERFDASRAFARSLPDDAIAIGETIPAGTTTALAVLTALDERATVSSSLPENPLERKRDVVETALEASDVTPGDLAGEPIEALRLVGDPVLATIAGLVTGATEAGIDVTLAGGTQLAAAGALVRHADVEAPLTLATTSFVAADDSARLDALAADLELELVVTDPGFEAIDEPGLQAYVTGEGKEGVGMGGALALAERADIDIATVRAHISRRYDELVDGVSEATP